MTSRFTIPTLLAASFVIAGAASAQTKQHPMAIDVPEGAKVSFECDVSDSDILKMAKSLIKTVATASVPKAPVGGTIASFPSPMGQVTLNVAEVSDLLKDIHRIHVVTYTPPITSQTDSAKWLAWHEGKFTNNGLGLRRMVYTTSKDMTIAIHRAEGVGGMGIVVLSGRDITVVRTDGPLNYALLDKWLHQVGRVQTAAK